MQVDVSSQARDWFEVLTGIVTFAGFVITLLIRLNQAKVRADLIQNQNEMKEDMDGKHAENKQGLAVHQAKDEEQFKSINTTLGRVEDKLDSLTRYRN